MFHQLSSMVQHLDTITWPSSCTPPIHPTVQNKIPSSLNLKSQGHQGRGHSDIGRCGPWQTYGVFRLTVTDTDTETGTHTDKISRLSNDISGGISLQSGMNTYTESVLVFVSVNPLQNYVLLKGDFNALIKGNFDNSCRVTLRPRTVILVSWHEQEALVGCIYTKQNRKRNGVQPFKYRDRSKRNKD